METTQMPERELMETTQMPEIEKSIKKKNEKYDKNII